MAVVELSDETFAAELAKADQAVVDFYAGWCGPCRLFKGKYKRLSEKYPGVTFFMVDGEKAPQARETVEIPGLPFFTTYRNGVVVAGLNTASEEAFEELLQSSFGDSAQGAP